MGGPEQRRKAEKAEDITATDRGCPGIEEVCRVGLPRPYAATTARTARTAEADALRAGPLPSLSPARPKRRSCCVAVARISRSGRHARSDVFPWDVCPPVGQQEKANRWSVGGALRWLYCTNLGPDADDISKSGMIGTAY
ncbi:hypothetical protein ACLOJK_041831 [Asimina triloba]